MSPAASIFQSVPTAALETTPPDLFGAVLIMKPIDNQAVRLTPHDEVQGAVAVDVAGRFNFPVGPDGRASRCTYWPAFLVPS